MFVYLVQHGEAKREEEDPARPLTDKGFQDVKKVAEFLKRANIKVSKVFHSDKTRAIQTARIFAECLNVSEIDQTDGLSPLDDPKIWFERINNFSEDVMLVGHLPHLSKLASLLLHGHETGVIDFKMGGVLCIKKIEDHYMVEWMIIPEIL